jgi:hypothetical protein
MLRDAKRYTNLVDVDDHVPKLHLLFHMILRQGLIGNARLHQNFSDESANKVLKRCTRNVSQLAWEPSVLKRTNESLGSA